ncbi:hypothetical protein [uncultured Streptomyces sp.]|uniref:hypothetical protein n=1 Tax=uncultured Streptomyces sp. TaxID=174707 RepID=UPI002621D50B|nr:hypothetical protein [uncultured Streptomyces sp.]
MSEKTPGTAARRSVRLASVAAVATLAGLLTGPGSAADEPDADVSVTYDCETPSGSFQVPLQVHAEYPLAGEVDVPMTPLNVSLTADLPGAELAPLLPQGATEVLGTAGLDVEVAQNDQTAQARWEQFTAPATPLDPTADVRLVHTGEVPSLTVGATGDVTLTAGALTLELTVPPAAEGETVTPVTLDCARSEGEAGLLATIAVPEVGEETPSEPSEGGGDPSEGGEDGGDPGDGDIEVTPPEEPGPAEPVEYCPGEAPQGEMDFSLVPPPPPGFPPIVNALPGTPVCGYAVGLASLSKLGSAMLVNDPAKTPGLLSVAAVRRVVVRPAPLPGGKYFQADSLATLELPDAEAAFLTFGFQPVSAKVHFENTPITITTADTEPVLGGPRTLFAVASFKQSLRMYDVKINGVPLDVGDTCGTPAYDVALYGDFTKEPAYINVLSGGPLNGTVDIPAFTGCGVGGENLNALFTAAVSGPGNPIAMNQGAVCIPDPENGDAGCPAVVPPLPGPAGRTD